VFSRVMHFFMISQGSSLFLRARYTISTSKGSPEIFYFFARKGTQVGVDPERFVHRCFDFFAEYPNKPNKACVHID
jgi:hypothetical protein